MNKNRKLFHLGMFFLLLIGMAVFPYIPLWILHINLDSLAQDVKMLYNFFCDVIYIFIVFLIFKDEMINDFKNYFKNFGKNFETSFKYYFIGLILMIVSNVLLVFFAKGANANNENAVRSLIDSYPLFMLFSVAVYAPFIEETIFRKCIKNFILYFGNNEITKYLYIIISGGIFALMHVLGMAESWLDYLYMIPYFALGAAFAALYYKTDNLFNSIIMHSIHNTVAVILYITLGLL